MKFLFFVLLLGCSNGVATIGTHEETETIPIDEPLHDSGEQEDTAG